ncbi:AEC family transporter [Tsukamurella sp. M9C]|uniref:AEC family transporter n=1 Tax=unclassified Tsukamurella TaxID=2633480 RepID=UPI001CCFCA34|nr:AEC family transporter [Tsukamurella sp. M9C]MCA0158068.1 AEC family transporter [Tsukamurella sp. M9C]
MTSVLAGFAVIAIIIAAGWLLGRLEVLGEQPEKQLSLLVFYLLTPALLLHALATTDVTVLFSSRLWVSAGSALAIAAVYYVIVRVFWRRTMGDATIGALASSYVNSSNLGIPIAVFVLHDTSYVAPLLLFQILVFSTIALTMLDLAEARERTGPKQPLWRTVATPLLNPIVVGALIGLTISLTRWHPPEWLMSPVKLLGDASVPMALIVFGLSLGGVRVLQKGEAPRRDIALATVLKMIAMPVLAWAMARFLFGQSGHALMAQTVTAALPTAQNVLVYGLRYNRGVILARDSGLITTALSIPAIMLIAVLLT